MFSLYFKNTFLFAILFFPSLFAFADHIEILDNQLKITLPNNQFKIKKSNKILPDFDILSVVKPNGNVIFKIYLGNHPAYFYNNAKNAHKKSISINGLKGHSQIFFCGILYCGEVLLKINDDQINDYKIDDYKNIGSAFVHLFFDKLSQDDFLIAYSIINSLKKIEK